MPHGSDLASLTLKDLRQLAGEHKVKNRSKLTKQELIEALTPILAQDGAASAAPAPEPEVLDPAAIAALTGESDDEDEDEDEDESGSRSGDQANAEGDDKPKRKRRRRRRRKKKSDDAEADGDQDAGDDDRENDAPKADTPARNKQPKRSEKADKPDRGSDDKADKSGRGSDDKAQRERKDDRPPRPSLDHAAKRKMPPMLERMRAFTEGILELCDPDTPTWAQARLSELLAGAGVVPTPCTGRPHPDFHRVVGTVATSEVPAGHIAVIEAPGFSLRGDRGDLFALRPATVRIAGDRASDRAPDSGKPSAADDDDDDDDLDEAEAAVAAPAKATVDTAKATVDDEADAGDEVAVADTAPLGGADADADDDQDPDADADADADALAADDASAASDDDEEERKPRRRRRRGRGRRDDDTDKADEPLDEAASTGPVLDEPEPAAPPRSTKVVPAEEAPTLPLVPQEAEELAARPKAEGWRALGLNEQILADLHDVGFTEPAEIQSKAIAIVTAGKDMIGQSQTGSGKTAAFVLPLLHRLYEFEGLGPAALVLCPTRELARQVHAEFVRMAGQSGARAALIYGGVGMDDQLKALARHPHVVIGTPGRVIDHARRRTLELSRLRICILDEADQMLDIGFLPDIEWVLKHTPPNRQMLLFSATMPDAIRKLAAQHMHEPESVHVAPKQVTVDEVDQKFIAVDRDKKTALLAHFIETYQPPQMVVFCNTKHQTDRVANVLKKKKLSAAAIHGDLPQAKREKVLQGFRDGTLNCLLATNVAARGLDIPSVSHVVNYDVPGNPEEYVHRVGRTARMGKKGVARTFVTPEDGQFVLEIEKHIGLLLDEEVVEGMLTSTAKKAERTIANSGTTGPRLLKPIMGGIRLGRARR